VRGFLLFKKNYYICVMAKQVNQNTPQKFEVIYEKEDSTHIWKYNYDKTKNGPVEVEIRYKKNYVHPTEVKKKTLGDLAKEARKESKKSKS
jgi:hypothetical protein